MRKIYLSLMALLLAVSTAFADTAQYKVDWYTGRWHISCTE